MLIFEIFSFFHLLLLVLFLRLWPFSWYLGRQLVRNKKTKRFSPVCPQRLPDIGNQTAALERMPKGRYEYLKRLLPYLLNQSEDCLYLNIYVPIQGKCWCRCCFCYFYIFVDFLYDTDAKRQTRSWESQQASQEKSLAT